MVIMKEKLSTSTNVINQVEQTLAWLHENKLKVRLSVVALALVIFGVVQLFSFNLNRQVVEADQSYLENPG